MSSPAMVPVFSPDGQLGDIPQEQVSAALSHGAKLGVRMKSPDGSFGYIPHDRVQEAIRAKATVAEPEAPKRAGFLSSFGSDLAGAGKGLITMGAAAFGNPIAQQEISQGLAEQVANAPKDWRQRKAEGHGLAYRLAAPAVGLVANVPGMEQAAREGDPNAVLGHMAAGQALAAAPLITEGAARLGPKAISAAKPVIAPVVRSTGKLIEAATTPEIAGRAVGGVAGAGVGKMIPLPYATAAGAGIGEEVGGAIGRNIGSEPLINTPRMQVYGYGEPAPGLRSVPEGPAAPNFIKQNTSDVNSATVYRARDVGESGIPYKPKSHAQATASLEQAKSYAEPGQRDAVNGKPQEVIGVDLSQTPGFSVERRAGNPPWYKFHGDVPESAVTPVSRPSFLDTKSTVNAIGDQIQQGLGGKALEPNVPLRAQGKTPSLPQGFSPVESSAMRGFKYDPNTREFETVSSGGQHYVYGDVSPEQAAKFESAESKGKAWNEIRNSSPLVAKVLNGKRVATRPVSTGNTLLDLLNQSVAQAKAKKQ